MYQYTFVNVYSSLCVRSLARVYAIYKMTHIKGKLVNSVGYILTNWFDTNHDNTCIHEYI